MNCPEWLNNSAVAITVYHGTSSVHQASFEEHGIRLVERPDKRRDFGTGFYTTTRRDQAEKYAKRTAAARSSSPIIVVCEVSVDTLKTLVPHVVLMHYDLRWLGILKRGRWGTAPLEFHWIHGRCGDGTTGEVQGLHERGADDAQLLKALTPSRRSPFWDNDQLWFGSPDAIRTLQLVEIQAV